MNLLIKRVDIDPTCAMCGIGHEDVVHSLITCDYTADIWTQSHLPIPNNVTNIFRDWFNDLMNVLDDDGIIYAVAILYYTWRTRNGAVWDAYLPRPRKVIVMASTALSAWKSVHHRSRNQQSNATVSDRHVAVTEDAIAAVSMPINGTAMPNTELHHPQQSTPSSSHHVTQNMRDQCYFDAAYDPRTNKAGVGAIILSGQGGYISAMTTPMIDCFSPLMAEAFACKEVLSWLRNREIKSIDLYTDCLVLQQYLSSMTHSSRTYLGYAIDSCRTNILIFDYCFLHYIPRLENYLAHTLASTAFTHSTFMYWDSDPPVSISAYFE
ncbi:PREDICTED: uncharacterized protein LOC109173524 [Ipomoea nil]|uniref:uncharacterized protein LOC109173524 n=1 Tax=Ipomoea nil TaxID=35883 RepID=UPI000900918E|nr:PREDICTED: uncharacterized protein LOC109173524 [Ipomoea nil]